MSYNPWSPAERYPSVPDPYSDFSQQPFSPYDQRSLPLPDLRSRELANRDNSGFAPNAGFNTPNPLINMVADMLIGQLSDGRPVRPIQGFSGSDMGYGSAFMRKQHMKKVAPELYNSNPQLEKLGKFGESGFAKQMIDQYGLTYGGSRGEAAEAAYGLLGNTMGGSIRDQAISSARMVDQVAKGFAGEDGVHDYNKSYGFNLKETMSNIDAAKRIGIGGIGQGVKDGDYSKVAKQSNALMKMGRQTFGEDMSNESILNLMDKASGGIASMSPEKSTDFMAKVQATSRALDVDAAAFAKYMAMRQGVMKQMGIDGAIGANAINSNAIQAKLITDKANATGDKTLGDRNEVAAAGDENTAAFLGSDLVKRTMAIKTIVANKTDGERLQEVEGTGGMNLDTATKTFNAAVGNGDMETAEKLRPLLEKHLGQRQVNVMAANMNPALAAPGEAYDPLKIKKLGSEEATRKHFADKVADNLGEAQGFTKEKSDQVRDIIKGGASRSDMLKNRQFWIDQGLTPEQAGAVMTESMLQEGAGTQTGGASGKGGANTAIALERTSWDFAEKAQAEEEKIRKDKEKVIRRNPETGALSRAAGMGEEALKFMGDYADDIKKRSEELEKEGKTLGPTELIQMAKDRSVNLAMSDEMEALINEQLDMPAGEGGAKGGKPPSPADTNLDTAVAELRDAEASGDDEKAAKIRMEIERRSGEGRKTMEYRPEGDDKDAGGRKTMEYRPEGDDKGLGESKTMELRRRQNGSMQPADPQSSAGTSGEGGVISLTESPGAAPGSQNSPMHVVGMSDMITIMTGILNKDLQSPWRAPSPS